MGHHAPTILISNLASCYESESEVRPKLLLAPSGCVLHAEGEVRHGMHRIRER